ncbi:hypothetical protein GCM10027280_41820 [Micromonospora polyrhachis]|uniref:Uncharacterized protein YukE n=1 Tax=Micromonospora polyrhachis TaxID=1282883 RepID=A0A7W7WMF8_9ACTN|nr:hypothetical protein [Micromonospora polyrhachis]MBB4957121.1 uncharacterized protein YukE [Micromonospora polyrhachis]
MAESDLRDPVGALTAAHRLMASLTALNDTVSSAASLVARTEQMAPLWGNDESGRRFRQNYTDFGAQLRPNIVQLAAGLGELGKSVETAVTSIAEADDPRYFTN